MRADILRIEEMRIALFPNGELDELFVDRCRLQVLRDGEARFLLKIAGDVPSSVLLWSPRRYPLTLRTVDETDWLRMQDATTIGDCMLDADTCDLHLEHMGRDLYWLGLSRAFSTCHFTFESSAYVKAKMLTPE